MALRRLIALAALALCLLQACDRAPTDAAAACASTPGSATLVLLDAPKPPPAGERLALEALVRDEAGLLTSGDRLVVAALDVRDRSKPATAVFSRCDLATPAARAALDAAVAAALEGRTDEAAPIVAAIDQVARWPEVRSAQRRRLVLASDMMERRAGEFSLYAAGADYLAFSRTQSGLRPPPDLSGFSVRVVQHLDADRRARQIEARETFWRPYFTAARATDVAWEP